MNNYAVVFPGQGSQSLNMLAPFAEYQTIVDDYCQRASNVLGYDIQALIQNGPEEKLNQTEYTQPALLVAGVIAWEIYKKNNAQKPAFFAGHSLGEYTALTCAGSIRFEDAVALVQARGQYMQSAVPVGVGAMAAIVGLDDAKIQEVCQSVGSIEDIAPANFNSIGQVVIAGKREAIEAAIIEAKKVGAKIAVLLPMSVPSHCDLMRPAANLLNEKLNSVTFNPPEIPVINNVDVIIETSPEQIKAALVKQLYSPVRWVEIIQLMRAQGVTTIIECGPGKVLAGLIKRIDKEIILQPLLENKG
ncbi:MAG: ACP S-malonyltransferase [Pseudomonadota bacterium]